ncbi:hypothetical protein W97_02345 [Coniosporium apollinis CBS 100218]|uniref:Zinc finger CHCC-type domain-containing protein n=1 Tax=Coniosporium apollinis (strain CBS 100218) TaxID=1168221 RepID=R7YMP4_CONA1|nr:uncharacterized protein W97_02345 [Coniosporium apollinis CBS 100218]EON63118.1 hypothetical protein W97_02345 [Coniosporium apollinis CBS 100218]
MLPPTARSRIPALLARQIRYRSTSAPSSTSVNQIPANDPNTDRPPPQNVSATNEMATSSEGSFDKVLQESVKEAEKMRTMQAPNRKEIWSHSQQPRARAMVGPRFEQTIMADQPRPLAAIELIKKQPVRWTSKRMASCDGGGGPLGHPRIFINVDKPQVCACTYCGVPYAREEHRKAIESLPSHNRPYPLEPTGQVGEVQIEQNITGKILEQR